MSASDLIDSIIMDLLKLKKLVNWEPAEEDVGWTIRCTDSLTGKSTLSTFKTKYDKQADIAKAYKTLDWFTQLKTRCEDDGPFYEEY